MLVKELLATSNSYKEVQDFSVLANASAEAIELKRLFDNFVKTVKESQITGSPETSLMGISQFDCIGAECNGTISVYHGDCNMDVIANYDKKVYDELWNFVDKKYDMKLAWIDIFADETVTLFFTDQHKNYADDHYLSPSELAALHGPLEEHIRMSNIPAHLEYGACH